MTKAPEQFIALQQAIGKIDALMRKAEDAAKIPDRRYNEANCVRLTNSDPYGGVDRIDKGIVERARQAMGRFVADDTRAMIDLRRSGAVEAIRGGADAEGLAAKMANNLSASNAIHKTYVPVDLDTVRQVDVARQKGRAK